MITVCDSASGGCSVYPVRTARIHWSLEDPSQAQGTEEERLAVLRRVRDAIAARLRDWLAESGRPGR